MLTSVRSAHSPLRMATIKKLALQQCTRKQAGITLIESLVSLLIAAIGVLAMLGVQIKTMADNQSATHRVIATRIADDLFERIKASPSGVTGLPAYNRNSSWAVIAAPVAGEMCNANTCTATQQATFDLWLWQKRAREGLPGGSATTFIPATDTEQIGVMVSWQLRVTDAGATSAEDTARAALLNVNVAGGPACPAGSMCHVAYAKP